MVYLNHQKRNDLVSSNNLNKKNVYYYMPKKQTKLLNEIEKNIFYSKTDNRIIHNSFKRIILNEKNNSNQNFNFLSNNSEHKKKDKLYKENIFLKKLSLFLGDRLLYISNNIKNILNNNNKIIQCTLTLNNIKKLYFLFRISNQKLEFSFFSKCFSIMKLLSKSVPILKKFFLKKGLIIKKIFFDKNK
ncbi:hypothetical protein [Buchnera aphidicola]|uniref:hypothetical protein n=1 Tax=Buchnera aphidicola TaxID=9 RepID=UPI003463D730